LRLQDKTLGLQHVEKDLAYKIGRRGTGHLQARAKPATDDGHAHARTWQMANCKFEAISRRSRGDLEGYRHCPRHSRSGFGIFELNSPLVAHAVHHARDSPIEDAVTRLKCRYMEGTSRVVLAATGVSHAEPTQIGILGSAIAAAAPLRPRYHE